MASIKDIAKIAGVSISTVSYALNGSPKVTEETRKRIMKIAEEIHYVPNAAARSLKTQQTNIVGVFLGDYSGAFYGELLRGMNQELAKQGYELVVCSGRRSQRLLSEKIMDGGIILGDTFNDEEIRSFADRGHRLVLLDRVITHENVRHVLLDNTTGLTEAMQVLLQSAPKQVFVVTGPADSHDSKERLTVVEAFAANHAVPVSLYNGSFTKASGIAAAEQFGPRLSHGDAIVCLNDEMALGVYDWLTEHSIPVGEAVSLLGFDGIEMTHYTTPQLATVDYSKEDWGALAAHTLIHMIQGRACDHAVIPSYFKTGGSIIGV